MSKQSQDDDYIAGRKQGLLDAIGEIHYEAMILNKVDAEQLIVTLRNKVTELERKENGKEDQA